MDTKEKTRRADRFETWVCTIVLVVVCVKWFGPLFGQDGTWGPAVGGDLPNGYQVWFRARTAGGLTDGNITVTHPNGMSEQYWIYDSDSDFRDVTIRSSTNGDRFWIEHEETIIAAVDVNIGEYHPDSTPEWAVQGTGLVVGRGCTRSINWYFGPW